MSSQQVDDKKKAVVPNTTMTPMNNNLVVNLKSNDCCTHNDDPHNKMSTNDKINSSNSNSNSVPVPIHQNQHSSFCPRMDRICDSILDCIGNTPLIRLNRIGKPPSNQNNNSNVSRNLDDSDHHKNLQHQQQQQQQHSTTVFSSSTSTNAIQCELLVKCEFFNAGGSVKDRIGKQMILDAEQQQTIIPNVTTLIEPTSGNTGIGIALAAAIKGYRCIITMPEKMSKEKVDVLKALGAEIVRTPTEAAFDAPDSHISVAKRLCRDTENGHILDQYSNPSNPNAHYYGTAEEIIRQCSSGDSSDSRPIDMFVAGAGTGGTITGIAKRLKEMYPNIIIVGVDPIGSILAVPDSLNYTSSSNSNHKVLECTTYQVEGIGYDFIPAVLDRSQSLIDMWIKTNDHESLVMMRKLIRDEGLLCGGSSGAAVCAALRAIHSMGPEFAQNPKKRVVILLPDSVRNYMTKALSDDWMSDHGFIDGDVIKLKTSYKQTWWSKRKVYEMPINTPLTITSNVRCKDAITLLKREGFDMVPVLDNDNGGQIIGVVTEGNITKCILSGRCNPDTPIADSGVIYKTFHKFTMNSTLGEIANALDHDPFVLIVTEQRCFSFENTNNNNNSNNNQTTPPPTPQWMMDQQQQQDGSSKKRKGLEGGIGGDGVINSSSTSGGEARMMTRSVVSGIVSRIDLLDFISTGAPSSF